MKRKNFQWLVFLWLFVFAWASPGLAVTVSTSADLKAAVSDSGSGDITLSTDITLSETISIDRKVTIDGNGHVISGDGKVRVFFIGSNDVTIKNLKIVSGSVSNAPANTGGAGILISADNVRIESCDFKNNVVTPKDANENTVHVGGAGIYTINSTGIVIKDCRFENNQVSGNQHSYSENGGAGIYNLALSKDVSIDIINCQFFENGTANMTLSGIQPYIVGGAMVNVTEGNYKLNIKIDNCSFDSNQALRYGGAIYNSTASKDNFINVAITNSTFVNNKLEGAKNNGSFGGAVSSYATNGGKIHLTISNSLFDSNDVSNTGPYNDNTYFGACGGAVGVFTYSDETNNANRPEVSTDIYNCRFENNSANAGGAIINWGHSGTAMMKVENSTFVKNKSVAAEHFDPSKVSGTGLLPRYPRGAAIFTRGAQENATAPKQNGIAQTTVINSTFTENESLCGGTVATFVRQQDKDNVASMDVINCTFVDNAITSSDYSGVDVFNDAGGTINLINSLFWKTSSDQKLIVNVLSGDTYKNTSRDIITIENCAVSTDLISGDKITSSDIVFVSTDWSPVSSEATNGTITHTIFVLSGDKNKPLAVLAAKGVSNDTTPTTDQVGTPRNDRPYIGAAEGPEITLALKSLSLDITPASKSITFTVGSETVSIDLSASFNLTVSGDYVYEYLPTETRSLDKGSYNISWQIVSDDWKGYGLYVDSNKFYVSKDATVGEYSVIIAAVVSSGDNITNSKDVIINITVANISPDITASDSSATVEKGEAISNDITITLNNNAQNIIWSISPDLPEGLTLTSSDTSATISGTVSTDAAAGTVNYTVTASNDVGSADLTITITVAEQTPEFASGDTYYLEVEKGKTATLQLSASKGTNLTWSLNGAPDWVSISSAGLITAQAPNMNSLGNKTFAVNLSNGTTSVIKNFTVNVIKASSSSLPVNSEGYYEGEAAQAPAVSSDENGNAVITTFTEFKNARGELILSADITMTIASEDFEGVVSDDFSQTFSVDVNLNIVDLDYNAYKFSMEASPDLPEGLKFEISGDVSTDTFTASGDKSYSYTVTISGTPSEIFDEAVNLKAVVKIDGDAPGLMAYASRDVNFIITDSKEDDDVLEEISVSISGDRSLSVYVGEGGELTLEAQVSGIYSVSGTEILDASLYELTWSIDSGDTAGIYLEDGTLTVTDEAETGRYRIPVKVSAQTADGELSAEASRNITVRVVNTAPELYASSTVINANLSSGDYTVSDITVEAVAGGNLTWTTGGTLPEGLSLTSSDEIFTISGTIPENAGTGSYSYTFTAENEIGSDSVTIAFNVFKSGGSAGLEPTIDSNGKVTFTAPASPVGFTELLNKLAASGIALSDIKELVIPSGVTDLNGIEALTNLTKLDLTSASSLTSVKLGANSAIAEINLSGNSSVTSVDLSGSNIQSLDLDGSSVAKVNVANCTKLTTLTCEDALGTGSLEEINLTGCVNLENLSCAGNKLLWLNLSDCTKLNNPSFSGQRRSGSSVKRNFSSIINFRRLLWDLLNGGAAYDESARTPYDVANISGVSYTSSDVYTDAPYDSSTGNATFPFVPISVKYHYGTGYVRSSSAYGSVSAADDSDGKMEVTLDTGDSSGGGGSGEAKLGAANVGCNSGFGLGILAAALAFALKKRGRS